MNAEHVDLVVAELTRVLTPLAGRDWSAPAGTLEWSCRETAAHIAHDLLAYAGQLAGRSQHAYLPFDLVVRPEAPVTDVLAVVAACGGLLAAALRASGPDTRAWHFGSCDPAGFAALGVAEVLVHTYDITRGLGADWLPPAALSAAALDRLVPDAQPGEPAEVLLRYTGRIGAPTAWMWRI